MEKFNLTPVENKGKRVLTTAQLAEAYGTDSRRISENFKRNRERFIEGRHFYCLTGKALKEFRANTQFAYLPKNIHTLYLWTEKGALLHAKSLNTEKAWEVYEFLVDNYFRTKEMIVSNNDLSPQVIGKLELLEHKIDMLEMQINTLDKNSRIKTDDIIKTLFDISNEVFIKGSGYIYNKQIHIIGKLEFLERKIDILEKNSRIRTDDIIKTLFDMSNEVFIKGLGFIYNKLSK